MNTPAPDAKPCPFCGVTAATVYRQYVSYVRCWRCGACGPTDDRGVGAIAAWNRRVEAN